MTDCFVSLEGPPSRWIAKHGLAAPALLGDGFPSYEPMDGGKQAMVVMENGIVKIEQGGRLFFLPKSYGVWCIVAPEGPVPLHHDPDAWWGYRPLIYRLRIDGRLEAFGSQEEIQWRKMLGDIMHVLYGGAEPFDYDEADDRAEAILREHLCPQQRIEYEATNKFRCRGGLTGNLYRIHVGSGFALVEKATNEVLVSYCLHPEHYLPHADVALATKLMLEDKDTEEETLTGARGTVLSLGRVPITKAHREARAIERELIQ